MEEAMRLMPGTAKLNIHASYAIFAPGEFADRDALEPKHFAKWVEFAKKHHMGIDFNPTFFSHEKVKDGQTLSSPDEETRRFWINHGKACIRISEYFAKETGMPCVMNIWTGDGFKDVPADHWANQAINTAVANGLMEGYPGDMFKPNKPVTRAEAMVTLAKGIPCEMDNCKAEEILSKYCDGNKVPSWAKIPVAKAIESGALKDVPNPNEIQACKDASRADVASMLEAVRCAMGYSKKDVAYTAPDCGCTGGAAFVAKDEVVTIPTMCLKFEDEISAKSATIGDRFAAKTTEDVMINGMSFPAGSKVYGKVTEVERPTGNCKGGLKLSFERIQNGDCKANLPQQVLTAQVKNDKKPNFFAKVIEAPFNWTGGVLGTVGRTVGGAIVSLGNAAEHVTDGVGLTLGETLQGSLPAAGRSLMDSTKALVKAPIDLTRTALSGTIGLLQHTGDEVAYLVDPKGNRVTSVNPRENITVAFGCNSCTGCAAPVQPCECDPCAKPAPCDCQNDCGCK